MLLSPLGLIGGSPENPTEFGLINSFKTHILKPNKYQIEAACDARPVVARSPDKILTGQRSA
jgi:hypothetical protein